MWLKFMYNLGFIVGRVKGVIRRRIEIVRENWFNERG